MYTESMPVVEGGCGGDMLHRGPQWWFENVRITMGYVGSQTADLGMLTSAKDNDRGPDNFTFQSKF